ncbi:hypothetical protein CDL12_28461 [Handroanthus impetiginosus]|uniref:Phytocyanin domain-containing protein n=1 Tax=Handroanthus impetiginosus TaxID=429701 RepID=A0A2G9G171_9LAMI|nr:hypothetical protein CDL12_28461 [Handroanthus impetiginosus]
MTLFGFSMDANHKIGDTMGWTASGTVDYTKWTFNKNFQVEDELENMTTDVKYNHHFHNVMEVDQKDFESCNSTSPILTYTTGHDSIKLTSFDHHYFVRGAPDHCDAEQKVDIFVRDHKDAYGPGINPPNHSGASPSIPFVSLKCSTKKLIWKLCIDYFIIISKLK